MKKLSLALTTVTAMFLCGFAHAQEAENEENLEYEKLKILEPLVGTYRMEWLSVNTGGERELLTTFSWSSSKKMLVADGKIRRAKPGEDISKQPWTAYRTRSYFVWNHVAKRIEMISVDTLAGAVHVSELKSKGAGVFSRLPVSSTLNGKAKEDWLVTVTEEGMTTKITNRVDANGERLDDVEYRSQRVEK